MTCEGQRKFQVFKCEEFIPDYGGAALPPSSCGFWKFLQELALASNDDQESLICLLKIEGKAIKTARATVAHGDEDGKYDAVLSTVLLLGMLDRIWPDHMDSRTFTHTTGAIAFMAKYPWRRLRTAASRAMFVMVRSQMVSKYHVCITHAESSH